MRKISEESRARIKGRRLVVSVSGGKDSAALSLHMHENGIEHDRIFFDTGWEAPETYDYLRGELAAKIGPITFITPPLQMVELARHKQMFPSRRIRFCTQELKIKPAIAYFEKRLDEGVDCINAVGIRAGESEARSTMTEWEWQDGFPVEVWRPLIDWSEQDVIDIILAHGLNPNPLYLAGASRVGCFPCIFSRKKEILFVAKHWPERIDQIRALELELTEAADVRRALKNEGRRAWDRSFFSGQNGPITIDAAVAWASQYGQTELFDDPHPGCARWGLCEAAK